MEINLVLKQHCIKTCIKRKYEQLVNKYFCNSFSEVGKLNMETEIETLKFLLENGDFISLRAKYSEINGADQLRVRLLIPANRYKTRMIFNEKTINFKWR